MNTPDLGKLAERIRASGVPTHFGPDKARLLIAVWRRVAEGEPVPIGEVEQIATRLDMPVESAVSFIQQLSERDEHNRIVGIFGLSQMDHPNKFFVNARAFSTWCAWDALFLPPMLKQSAQIESVCPQTDETIRVQLTPQRVETCEPDTAVLSMVTPRTDASGIKCVEEVWAGFCCDVRFFQSETAAKTWFTGNSRNVSILSVEEGFRLGLLAFRELLEYV